MYPEQLIPGETILTAADNDLIVLTTHRIRYNYQEWGQGNTISIMLEKISSIQARYISYPLLIVMGIFLIIVGFLMNSSYPRGIIAWIPAIIGIGCIIYYFYSKNHFCIISSDGGARIIINTKDMDRQAVLAMIDKIETAKSERVSDLVKN
jgi:hypothetical protein